MQYTIGIINSNSFGKRFPEHKKRLEAIGTVAHITVPGTMHGAALAAKCKDYNILISGVTPLFDEAFFEHKQDVLLLSRHGIGYNNIHIEAAAKVGTIVSIVPPLIEQDAVAENAVANVLAVIRKLPQASQAALANRWSDRAQFVGHTIAGKKVGILGCGNIGTKVAEIFKYGFHTTVFACDPCLHMDWAKQHGIKKVGLTTLLKEVDILSLNASLNPSSFHILSRAQFAIMKRGMYITNTARGALIDETAMCEALDSGIVAGFASDVMQEEPASHAHPYFSYANVLVTPHTSAYTYECLQGMGEKCVQDVECIVNNKKPQYVVTTTGIVNAS